MAVSLDHPAVADYLRRLESAAARLPAGRREELVEEIRGHVADALGAIGDDEAAVRGVLDRLGSPEEIVAAEDVAEPAPAPPPAYVPPSSPPPVAPAPAAASVLTEPARPGSRVWGPLELVAVLGLTLGTFLLPIVGPLVGLVCAWLSDRWTRREKVIATVWAALAPLVVVLAGLSVFVAREGVSSVEQAPTIVEEPAELFPAPSPEVTLP